MKTLPTLTTTAAATTGARGGAGSDAGGGGGGFGGAGVRDGAAQSGPLVLASGMESQTPSTPPASETQWDDDVSLASELETLSSMSSMSSFMRLMSILA